MNFAHRWTGLSLAVLLAGCAAPAADRQAPWVASVPPTWQITLPPSGAAQTSRAGWSAFGDPLLLALIEAASSASPSLVVAQARIERARAALAGADATLLPRLDAQAQAARARQVPGQAAVASSFVGVQAGWEIDLFGAARAGRVAAQARLQGAQAGWHEARAAVEAETAGAYVTLRACEAQVRTLREDARSREQTADLTAQSQRAGFAAPADAALARAGAAQARNAAAQQNLLCQTLLKGLVEMTAIPEENLSRQLAAGTGRVPQAPGARVDVLPAALLTQRPDIADALQAVQAAAADADQSRARQLPQISLSGSVGLGALRSTGVTLDGNTWSLGPLVVNLPLFDAGARRAATSAAQAGYDEAVALIQAQLRRAVREVEASLAALRSSAERETDALTAAQDFELTLRATQARQQGGLASLFDLEAARRNALAAHGALIELQRERAQAWINLYRALGGGWQPATDPGAP
jgi:multidrug efflux system outer membrane protein